MIVESARGTPARATRRWTAALTRAISPPLSTHNGEAVPLQPTSTAACFPKASARCRLRWPYLLPVLLPLACGSSLADPSPEGSGLVETPNNRQDPMVPALTASDMGRSPPASAGAPNGADDPNNADAPNNADGEPTAVSSPAPIRDPGWKGIHRLNSTEYNATVKDVLGVTLQPANARWRGGELAGFDNVASVLGMDPLQYERYLDAARDLAAEVFASEKLRSRFVNCEPSAPECARSSLTQSGLRLFRRPLGEDEVARYYQVYEKSLALGDPPLDALQLAFRAQLSSAEFLYRTETDELPQSTEPHPLNAFELASRLSYFLWSSAPDEALLHAAQDSSLLQPETLRATVNRMLEDPKSERFVTNFAGQWLEARRVPTHAVAAEVHSWDPHLSLAASQEIYSYFSEFLRTERSWFEFLHADVNYVNSWLARHYGMPRPTNEVDRVEFTEDDRAGFFGLAGFLAVTSFDRRTSPSLRGYWVTQNLLCAAPPAPPPDITELPGDTEMLPALDVREALERHSQSPECASCHQLFDPYGLALEEFDAVGRRRDFYTDDTPVDTHVTLPVTPEHPAGLEVSGHAELAQAITSDPRFGRCVAEKLLTYALGRPVIASDEPYLQEALESWQTAGAVPQLKELIQALVATEAFRFRRGKPAQDIEP